MDTEKILILRNVINHIGNNNWNEAHDIVQQHESEFEFDRLHALLHRIEGDTFNARWWYKRLGLEMPNISFDEELEKIKVDIGINFEK